VLRLVTRGFTSREMGDRLFISSRTVENHVAELYRKLHLNDSRQLSCEAYLDEEDEPPFGER
jgi:two-component system response regulator NreC